MGVHIVKEEIKIIGLGFCGLDYLSLVPRIPTQDKVEIVRSLIQGGGPAATAIFAAQRLGASTAFISAIGDDARGECILSELTDEGVDCSSIDCQKGAVSPVAFCWVDQTCGERGIAWHRGTTTDLVLPESTVELMDSAKVLHLDGHHTQAALAAMRLAKECNVQVVCDAGTMLPGIEKIMEGSDVIIASEDFSRTYTGKADPLEALKVLAELPAQWVVITLGSNGSVGFDGKGVVTCPAFDVDVVDTTGAGDVFHGAFVYKYLDCGDLLETMRFASAVSAIKCTEFGGRTGIPTLEIVEDFLEKL